MNCFYWFYKESFYQWRNIFVIPKELHFWSLSPWVAGRGYHLRLISNTWSLYKTSFVHLRSFDHHGKRCVLIWCTTLSEADLKGPKTWDLQNQDKVIRDLSKKIFSFLPTQSRFPVDNHPTFLWIINLRALDSDLILLFPNLCLVYTSKKFP